MSTVIKLNKGRVTYNYNTTLRKKKTALILAIRKMQPKFAVASKSSSAVVVARVEGVALPEGPIAEKFVAITVVILI